MENLIFDKMPTFININRVKCRFAATQENTDRLAEYIKDLMSEKNDFSIEVYRIDDEIALDISVM